VNEFSLAGKRALVTGAGRGLGRDIAVALADYGADIVGFARTRADLDALGPEIEARDRRFLGVSGSVADGAALDALHTAVEKAFGGVDILVNNAGITAVEPALELGRDAWNAVLDVNLSGAFFCSRLFARGMIARRFGRVINISSVAGSVGLRNHAAYCASKAGLEALTRVLAIEWGPAGVTVNAIAPTVVLTEMGQQVWGEPSVGDPMKSKIPIGRFGDPREVAAACVYLSSEIAGLCNGTTLTLDGGYSAL